MEGLKPSANYDMVNAQTAIAIAVKIMLVKLIEKLFKRLKYTDSNDSNHSHVLENSFKTSESLTQSCSWIQMKNQYLIHFIFCSKSEVEVLAALFYVV